MFYCYALLDIETDRTGKARSTSWYTFYEALNAKEQLSKDVQAIEEQNADSEVVIGLEPFLTEGVIINHVLLALYD